MKDHNGSLPARQTSDYPQQFLVGGFRDRVIVDPPQGTTLCHDAAKVLRQVESDAPSPRIRPVQSSHAAPPVPHARERLLRELLGDGLVPGVKREEADQPGIPPAGKNAVSSLVGFSSMSLTRMSRSVSRAA